MFEVGFTEIILIAGLALIVLGPQRLPGLASQIGRWVGRARAMARQLREQLDQEVNLKQEPWRQRSSSTPPPEPDDDGHLYPEGRSHRDAGEDPVAPEPSKQAGEDAPPATSQHAGEAPPSAVPASAAPASAVPETSPADSGSADGRSGS